MSIITEYIYKFVEILQSIGLIGGFILVLIESIFPPIPLAVVIGINFLSFGALFGGIISWTATIVGCLASFLLFRTLFKHKVYFLFEKNKKLQKKVEHFMIKMGNIDFNALVVLLAIPFTPAFAVNIAGGLSNISFKKYFCALLISKISIVYFWGYVGSSFIESMKNPTKLIEVFALVFLAYLVSKIFEKVVKVEV